MTFQQRRLVAIAAAGLLVGALVAIPLTGGSNGDRLSSVSSVSSVASASSVAGVTTILDAGGSAATTLPGDGSTSAETSTSVVQASSTSAGSTTTIAAAPTTISLAAPPDSTVVVGPANPVPSVDAAAYVVFDASGNRVLASLNGDQPRSVGSLMKLLTAYVVMQAGDPERLVTVPQLTIDQYESQIGLVQGEQLSRAVLLRAMLIVSANDAAQTLAGDVGGGQDQFVAKMNAAAAQLGLDGTVAANAVGIDAAGQQSTANDMLLLSRVLMRDTTFQATVARPSAKLHGQVKEATNDLLRQYAGATGIKTGHTTQAGFCLAGSAQRSGRTVIVVVLGSSTDAARLSATTTLLDWAFAQP